MFIANHKVSIVIALAVVCIGLTGSDLITQSVANADLKQQFYTLDEFNAVDTGVNMIVHRSARYTGGKKAMREDLAESFIYPMDASETGDEGKVLVRFTINTDGSVNEVKVIRSISRAIDSAVQAAVMTLSKWEPAIQNGLPIKSTIVVPFKVTQ